MCDNRTEDVICEENISFSQLNLKPSTLKGLLDNGFKYPSPIQIKAIPMGLLGLDLIIQAKSGTGKTCVFSVISLERIIISSKAAQVLIISPTREIALQTMNVIKSIGLYTENLVCQLFIGGIKVCQDLKNIKNCHIIVGTPGRIKYLIEEKHIQTEHIRLLVLDEADMLFTDNFHNTMNFIYNTLPIKKQMITLSATYTETMIDIIAKYMNSPVMIRLNSNEKATLLGVKHYFKEISDNLTPQQVYWSKTESLLDILSSVDFQQCIVFSNYQAEAQDLCDALEVKGWPSAYISGNLDQKQRIEIYNKLKTFQLRVLITTDLTSRGIDADNVDLVINLELPWECETYLHRVGRAGRYGKNGVVISIITHEEKLLLDNIRDKCFFSLNELPIRIPCDLLHGRVNTIEDNLIVQKLETNKNPSGNNNLFHIFEQYNDNISTQLTPDIFITRKPKYYEMNHEQISERFTNGVNDILEDFPIAKKNNYNVIERVICESRNDIIRNENYYPITKPNNSAEIKELKMECTRLVEWSIYYSNQYRSYDNEIISKTIELENLLSVNVFE